MLLFLHCLARQFIVGEPLADDLRDGKAETSSIVKVFPIVVAKRLLV